MPPSDKKNNFGVLRLFFANLVICYHSYFLIDGDTHRDIFYRAFGTTALGGLGVAGFFLISGFLVVKSYCTSKSVKGYFLKRFLRIWPGFAVAFLVCLFIVVPLGGGQLAGVNVLKNIYRFMTFQEPDADGVFHGLAQEQINGSMWTISYEFRCYMLVILLGACGLLRDRRKFLALTLLFGLAAFLPRNFSLPYPGIFGAVSSDILFTGVFCAGGLFYLYRDVIKLRLRYALLAFPLFIALLFGEATTQIALMTAGAYILFCIANYKGDNAMSRFTEKTDFSYGIYLYSYPVQQLILWHDRTINMYQLMGLSLVFAWILGAMSWFLVEKPALSLKSRLRGKVEPTPDLRPTQALAPAKPSRG
jgi:peptidoglycan/LPS O-acetylase OafA/YrhL